MNTRTLYICIGASFGLLTVIFGAFGAHALKEHLSALESIETWKTAVDYQAWHALALLLWVALSGERKLSAFTGISFTLGIILFSGSLYALALGGPSWLGPVTPLGGLFLMTGWASMLIAAFQSK